MTSAYLRFLPCFCLSIFISPYLRSQDASPSSRPHNDRSSVALAWAHTIGIQIPDGYALEGSSATQQMNFVRNISDWSGKTDEVTLPVFGEVEFDDLSSTVAERLERVPSVKIEGAQTPKYVYGIPYGASTGTLAGFIPNPDSNLFNYSATLNLAEAFLSVSDRAGACKIVASLKDAGVGTKYDKRSNFCTDYRYLTGNRSVDLFQRVGAGLSLTYTASQNAKFQSSLVQADAGVSFSNSVTGSFDPNKMWRTASDWLAAISVFNPDINDDLEGDGDHHSSKTGDYPCISLAWEDGCFFRYAYGRRSLQLFQALLPKIDVKVVTPLNFQTANNVFLAQPFGEHKLLYTVSATIDLTRFIPNSSTRADAASVIGMLAKAKKDELAKQKLRARTSVEETALKSVNNDWAEWRQKVTLLYSKLASHPELLKDEAWWKMFQSTVFKL